MPAPAASLTLFAWFWLLTGWALAGETIPDLPAAFYARPGLEQMPHLPYSQMPVINLRELGAANDGSQPCNDLLRQAVAQAQQAGGGIVYLPAGLYKFTSPDPQPELNTCLPFEDLKNVHLVGAGLGTVLQMEYDASRWFAAGSDKTAYFLFFRRAENCSLRDLSLSIYPYYRMRSPGPCEGAFAVAFSGCRGMQVVGVRTDQGRMGICFWEGNTECWVIDCDVRNTGADAIKFDHCQHIVAAYNHVERNNDDGFSGLAMSADKMFALDNRFLYNTLVYNNGWGRGIVFSGHQHVVEGNWLESQAMPAIYFHQCGLKKGIEGQRNEHCRVAANHLVRTDNHDCAENQLVGHRLRGAMAVMHDQYDMEVVDNVIEAAANNGLCFSAGWKPLAAEKFVLRNNRISGCRGYGLAFMLDKPQSLARDIQLQGNQANANDAGDFFFTNHVEGLTGADNRFTRRSSAPEGVKLPDGLIAGESDLVCDDPYREPARAEKPADWGLEFTPPPAGTVLNAKAFGAKGDGQTDDTPALAAALAALGKNGGTLKIPAGIYRLSPLAGSDGFAFTCLKHHLALRGARNVCLEGEPGRTQLIFTSWRHEGLRLIECQDVSVKDLEFSLAEPQFLRWNRALLDLSGSQRVSLANLSTRNACGAGIRIDSCRQVKAVNCQDRDSSQVGIEVWASFQVEVRDCRIENARDHGLHLAAHGSIARLPQFIRLSGNTIDRTREGYGLSLTSGNEVVVEGNRVSGAYLAGIGVYAMNPTFPHERFTIRGNTLTDCGNGRLAYVRGAIAMGRMTRQDRRSRGEAQIVVEGNTVRECPHAVQINWCEEPERLQVKTNDFQVTNGEAVKITKYK